MEYSNNTLTSEIFFIFKIYRNTYYYRQQTMLKSKAYFSTFTPAYKKHRHILVSKCGVIWDRSVFPEISANPG